MAAHNPIPRDERQAAVDRPYLQQQMFAAHYSDTTIPAHRGNPLIETLPPLRTRPELDAQLKFLPPYHDDERTLSVEERLHLLPTIERFFQPLPQHLDLADTISTMLRDGYVGRNPTRPGYLPTALQRLPSVLQYHADFHEEALPTPGFTLIGESGIGKTRGMSRVLRLYPQVIVHSMYQGQRFSHLQLVYLQISCPHDGSRKALCKQFFLAVDQCLGTRYFERYAVQNRESVDSLLIHMGNICLLHHVGVLVIDEVQNLREATAQDVEKMLNFFTQLDNEIKIPVILIGTPRARPILTGGFRRARRAEGQGGLTWERMQRGGRWDLFVRTLWRYQYTRQRCPLTPKLSETLWDESQGVADIAIKLYILTQVRAIRHETERITVGALKATARTHLQFVGPFLAALRKGDYRRLASDPTFDDLTIPLLQRGGATAPSIMPLAPDTPQAVEPSSELSSTVIGSPSAHNTGMQTERGGDGVPRDGSLLSSEESLTGGDHAGQRPQDPVGERSVGRDTHNSHSNRRETTEYSGDGERGGAAVSTAKHRPTSSGLLLIFDARRRDVVPYDALRAADYMRPVSAYLTEERATAPTPEKRT